MDSSLDLHQLDVDDLAEKLVEFAQLARKLVDRGQVLEVADLLSSVRAAADGSIGPKLALLEVAEAFLRTLSRSDLGKTEVALRRFAVSQPDGGASILGPLASGSSIEANAVKALGRIGQELIDVGALRVLDGGRCDLRPSLRALARDLVEPAAFRMWRRVNEARGMVGLGRMKGEQAAAYIASEFGVTQQQAEQHLKHSPLVGEETHQPTIVPTQERKALRVVYSRATVPTVLQLGQITENPTNVIVDTIGTILTETAPMCSPLEKIGIEQEVTAKQWDVACDAKPHTIVSRASTILS